MRPILLHGHERNLTQIKYNRHGDLLFSAAKDKKLNVWFSSNGERLGSYEGHRGAVYSLDVDYNCQRLITASADQTWKVWDVEIGKELYSVNVKTPAKSIEFALGDKQALVMTSAVMGAPGILAVYPVDGNNSKNVVPIQSIVLPTKPLVARWGNLNESIIVGNEDGSVSMWNPISGENLNRIHPHSGPIMDIQFSSDKSYFITSSLDMTARIFDSRTLEEKKVYAADRPLRSASISPIMDQVIIAGGQDPKDVTVTGAKQGKFEVLFYHSIYADEIGKIKGHFGPVNTLAFHPMGTGFSSGGEEGYIRIHNFDEDYYEFEY